MRRLDVLMGVAEGRITQERADYLLGLPKSDLARRKVVETRKENGGNCKGAGRKDRLIALLEEWQALVAAGRPIPADLQRRLHAAELAAGRALARKAARRVRTEGRPVREYEDGQPLVRYRDPETGKSRLGVEIRRQVPDMDVALGWAAEHTYDDDERSFIQDVLSEFGVDVFVARDARPAQTRPLQTAVATLPRSSGEVTPPNGSLANQHPLPGTLRTVQDEIDHTADGMIELYREREDVRWLSAAARLG